MTLAAAHFLIIQTAKVSEFVNNGEDDEVRFAISSIPHFRGVDSRAPQIAARLQAGAILARVTILRTYLFQSRLPW